jgi:hypothetical protein
MQAFKFLKRGAIGPVSGFAWPAPSKNAPGAWVGANPQPTVCSSGVHACREDQVAYWIHQELWAVELGGEVVDAPDCVVAPRGRLLRPVSAWSDGGAKRFSEACRDRLVERLPLAQHLAGYVDDWAVYHGREMWTTAAWVCVMTLARIAAFNEGIDEWSGYRRERAWQSQWIVRQLIGA